MIRLGDATLLVTSADVRLNVGVETIQDVQIAVTREIALWTVSRRRLKDEVFSGRVAQLEKRGVGVLSRFVVANDMDAEVKQAFILRPHLVDNAAGFVRMDVLSPEDMPNEIWLMTYWIDIASYRTWHKSHAYHESHAGIPKELKLVPGSAALRIFNLIAT
jgi:heme oxygenase (mycobilin-producing)